MQVTIDVNDLQELKALGNLMAEILQYRAANASPATEAPTPSAAPAETATTESGVVATITPAGAIMNPKDEDLIRAAEQYVKQHNVDQMLELVRQFTQVRMTEEKNPATRAKMLQALKDGVA